MGQAPFPRPGLWPLALVPFIACSGAGGSDAEGPEGGWMALFNGTSLEGWRGVEGEQIPEGHWIVEDGVIRKLASADVPKAPDGQPLVGGDIMTVLTFQNFELEFEWKVAPGANSGVKYNVSQSMSTANVPSTAALGFEYQVLDDDLHPDAANGPTRQAGALYDMIPPNQSKSLNRVGEFNEARIVFNTGRGEHWLNGEKVLDFQLGSDDFNEILAASKYAPIDGFAHLRRGHIVLQDHGDDVWFKNIRIREVHP